MRAIGYHASHELYGPRALLEHVRAAEAAGLATGMCSDHFFPWTPAQGQSGFAWSWLGAALEATKLDFGTVCAPGQRYHPAVIAQAAATLAVMYPGRFWLAVGTGQNLNEHITGEAWPSKPERRARLRAAVDVIRSLWGGETVNLETPWFTVRDACLYTRPESPPLLFGAALTAETASWVGTWADGMITVAGDREDERQILEAFVSTAGEFKPARLQAAVSWAPTAEEALNGAARNWPVACLDLGSNQDLARPEDFERAVRSHRPEELRHALRISADLGQHAEWFQQDLALGFETIYLHPIGGHPERFLEVFVPSLLARLEGTTRPVQE